jgi:hypothetical protein
MGDAGPMSPADRELWEYFAELYKNSNKGIKGRGKDRRISTTTGHGHGHRGHGHGARMSSMESDEGERKGYEDGMGMGVVMGMYAGASPNGGSTCSEGEEGYYLERR